MCLTTAANQSETIEVLIGEERIQVNRKMLMEHSKFFKTLLSTSPENTEESIVLQDVSVSTFNTFLKACSGDYSSIDHTNVSEVLSFSHNIEAQVVFNECFTYMMNMTEKQEAFVTFNLLEKLVETEEKERKQDLYQEMLTRIYCPVFLAENKHYFKTISSEAKTFLLETLVDNMIADSQQKNKEVAKMKKLEQKCSILESQLRKAIDEIKASKDQQKAIKDSQSELAKLKKKLVFSEKKIKSQEEELEKMGKKLTSENKKNQLLQMKIQETMEIVRTSEECYKESIEMEKKMFEARLKEVMQSHLLELETVQQYSETEKRIMQSNLTDLKETVVCLQEEIQAVRNPSRTNADTSTDDLITRVPSTSCSIETQTESKWKRYEDKVEYKLHPLTESAFYGENSTMGFEWKQRPVWIKAVFL